MSKKTYIKVNEFIKSWNKNQHDLDNIDFAMYKMVNLLGYELEYRLFSLEDPLITMNLSYEQICELSFMVIDRLEVFFRSNCTKCKLKCYKSINSKDRIDFKDLPKSLQDYQNLGEKPTHLDCLKLDLSLNVIEPRMKRFIEKQNIILNSEDKIQITQISKFIEDNIITFILNDCFDLISNPNEKSLKDFSEKSLYDDLFSSKFQDLFSSGSSSLFDSGFSDDEEPWRKQKINNDTIFDTFMESYNSINDKDFIKLSEELSSFQLYVSNLDMNINDISPIIFFKYLATEFIKNNCLEEQPVIYIKLDMIKNLAEKIDHEYELDNSGLIKTFIKNKKSDILRVTRMSKSFIKDYDVTTELFETPDFKSDIQSYFTIVEDQGYGIFNLQNILTLETMINTKLNHSIMNEIAIGDILNCRVILDNDFFQIKEIHQIYPGFSKPYLH